MNGISNVCMYAYYWCCELEKVEESLHTLRPPALYKVTNHLPIVDSRTVLLSAPLVHYYSH